MASPAKRWRSRLLAVLLGLSPFIAFECICVGLDWGNPTSVNDPFIGFEGTRRLFVPDLASGTHKIAENRYLCFRADEFLTRKPDNEFRIFVLGGSTVQGRPYAIETSFAHWFQLSLQAADPDRQFDVINCGGISYASYRLVPILQEVIEYEPDLILLYTGHNEFLEDRTYQSIKRRSQAHRLALKLATRLRTYNLVWNAWNDRQSDRVGAANAKAERPDVDVLPTEVQAMLDYEGGLALYQRDPEWRDGVVEHFESNVRRCVQICRAAGVPIWIANPVSNLRGSPPFKSLNRDDLSAEERDQWIQLRQAATERFATNPQSAFDMLHRAMEIDDQHAGLAYDLGKCYEMTGRMAKAKHYFVRAKELDICPLRIIEPLRERLTKVVREFDVPLIDVQKLFFEQSRDGIPGGFLLVDHVHPSITGHQLVAGLLVQQAMRAGIIQPVSNWEKTRDIAYQEHMASLDDKYFLEGQRRLEGLTKWAQGRAKRKRD